MSLDASQLAAQMFAAFKQSLSDKWPDTKEYASSEAKKLAENFVMIEKLKVTGQITNEQARLHHEIQRNASRAVLLTVEGLGLLAVEQALMSAFSVLQDAVNSALGFDLL